MSHSADGLYQVVERIVGFLRLGTKRASKSAPNQSPYPLGTCDRWANGRWADRYTNENQSPQGPQ